MQGSRVPENPPWKSRLALLRVQSTFVCAPLITTARKPRSSWRYASANRCAWCSRSGARLWNRIHLCPAQPSRSLCDHLQASSNRFKTNIHKFFSSKKLWFLAPFYGFSHLTHTLLENNYTTNSHHQKGFFFYFLFVKFWLISVKL